MQLNRNLESVKSKLKSKYILVISYAFSIAITILVYLAGGTNKVYTNLMYIPIAVVSSVSGKKHGIIHAGINGLLLGPFMPFDAAENIKQPALNWIIRLIMYVIIAYVIGFFSDHYKQEIEKVSIRDDEIFNAQMATIYSLVKLAESRDHNTGEHVLRVAELCRILAERLRCKDKYKNYINDDYIENIYKAAPLHDIGKVGISDNILLKPGKLTPEEFTVMKKHALIGENTLLEVKQKYPGYKFLEMAMHITRHHHEWWNGNGYPDGLSGDSIPLSARIMALADTYDALRSKRAYKEAYSHEKSREIIILGSGSHFDPDIVEAFIECEDEIAKIY